MNIINIIKSKEFIAPVTIVFIGFVLFKIITKAVDKLFEHKAKFKKNSRYKTIASLLKNVIKYFLLIICGVMILDIFGIDTKSIITSLGVVGVVAGLALQDFLKDFIAGVTIILENQFSLGDIISIGDFKGTVTVFTLKTTRVKAWTGEEKIIANHLATEVVNYTHNNSIAIVDVGIAYEEDLDNVEKILNKLCTKLSASLDNLKSDVTLLGIENLDSSSIVYRVTAEVKAGEQFDIQRQIRKAVKDELDKQGICIPYNQLVVHNG